MSEVIVVALPDDSAAPEQSVTDSEVQRKAEFDEEDSEDEETKEQPADYATEQQSQTDSGKENEPDNVAASPSPANATETTSQTSESTNAASANPRSSVMSTTSASSSRRSSATGTGVYRSHWSVHADLNIKAHSFLPKKPTTSERSRTMPNVIAASALATRATSTRIGVNVKAEREKYERLRKAREAAEQEENERKASTGVAVKRPGTSAATSLALMGEKGVVQPRVTHKGHLVGLASDDSELLIRRGVHPDAASIPLVGVDESLAQFESVNGEVGQGSVSWARMGAKGKVKVPALALESKVGRVSNTGTKSARGVLSRNQGTTSALSHAGVISSASASDASHGTLTEHGRAAGMAGMGGASRGPFASRMQSDTGAALARGVRASSAAHSGKISESALSDPHSIDSIRNMASPRGKTGTAAIVGVISPRGNIGQSAGVSRDGDSSAHLSTMNGAAADSTGTASEIKMNGRVPSLRISSDITNNATSDAKSSRSARGSARGTASTTQAIPEETIQQRILRSKSMARLAESKSRTQRPSRPPLSHSMSNIALLSSRSSSSGGPNSARGRLSSSASMASLSSEKRRSMPHPLTNPPTTGHRTRTGLWTTEPVREPSSTN